MRIKVKGADVKLGDRIIGCVALPSGAPNLSPWKGELVIADDERSTDQKSINLSGMTVYRAWYTFEVEREEPENEWGQICP